MTLKDRSPIKENSVFNYTLSSLTGEIIKTVMVIFILLRLQRIGTGAFKLQKLS